MIQLKFKNLVILSFLFAVCSSTIAQKKEVKYELGLSSSVSTASNLPFWMVSNKNGLIPDQNNALLDAGIYSTVAKKSSGLDFSFGANLIGYESENPDLKIGQLYGNLQWKSIQLIIGSKYEEEQFAGLSSSNGNLLSSKNSRPFPGINLRLADFVPLPFVSKSVSVKGNWSEYLLNDTRAVDKARLHHKSLFFKVKASHNLEIIAGLDDYAMWAGESASRGKQASGFKDYLKVITGSSGGSNALETDQINALGNHIGMYTFQLNHKAENLNWSFYWNHPFEDRSGRELANIQDGLYGLFFDFKNDKKWINKILYEFYYTKNQSGRYGYIVDENGIGHIKSGGDNYFNNGVYSSGWTFYGRTIGSPFFTPTEKDAEGRVHGVVNNRFVAHHVGINGYLAKKLPYQVMLSYSINSGTYSNPFTTNPKQLSALFEVKIPENKLPFDISTGIAADFGDYLNNNFGCFIRLTKKGIF